MLCLKRAAQTTLLGRLIKNRLKGGKVLNNAILDLKNKIESGRELTEHDQMLLSAAKKSRIRGAENVSGSFIIRSEEGLNTEYDREKASVLLTQKVANREKKLGNTYRMQTLLKRLLMNCHSR